MKHPAQEEEGRRMARSMSRARMWGYSQFSLQEWFKKLLYAMVKEFSPFF
jgi:hypothetical protein